MFFFLKRIKFYLNFAEKNSIEQHLENDSSLISYKKKVSYNRLQRKCLLEIDRDDRSHMPSGAIGSCDVLQFTMQSDYKSLKGPKHVLVQFAQGY